MLKKAVRRTIRRARAWLAEPEMPAPLPDPRQHAIEEHSYQWLNAAVLNLVRDATQATMPVYRMYVWGTLEAAGQAKTLGIPRISVVEFGVASGRGLVALEWVAAKVHEMTGVEIDVFGFDTGTGLTEPIDHRDVPNLLWSGRFPMDVERLRARLKRATLVLGPIADTLAGYCAAGLAPVGFVSVDVDLYSATVEALRLFATDTSSLLPGVYVFFDDIMGYTYSDCNGERLAMTEFNASHPRRPLCKIHGLRFFVNESMRGDKWVESVYITHVLDHPQYAHRSSSPTYEVDQLMVGLDARG
jgi:hypothetical protein